MYGTGRNIASNMSIQSKETSRSHAERVTQTLEVQCVGLIAQDEVDGVSSV